MQEKSIKQRARDFVAKNLVRLRQARGWSQTELAEKSGVSVGMIEAGKRWPRENTVSALASALECNVADFYAEPEEK